MTDELIIELLDCANRLEDLLSCAVRVADSIHNKHFIKRTEVENIMDMESRNISRELHRIVLEELKNGQ